MPFASEWLYRRLGWRYFWAYAAFDVISALLITAGTLGIFVLYTGAGTAEFWRAFAIAELSTVVGLGWVMARAKGLAWPLVEWLRAGKPASGALDAWQRAARLPRDFAVANGWRPFVIVGVPVAVLVVLDFGLPWYSAFVVFAGASVAIAYAAVLHFFASELALRPVLRDAAALLPPDFAGMRIGVPLRWKLLGALPLINVITGVVVSGLSTNGHATLNDLGVDVLVAVAVAFTISFELTLLLTKSIYGPVNDLLAATERVADGDLSARVPVLSGDELGDLAGSFNEMMSGLEEREKLQSAFGSYVDPEVARRVLDEGELLEGEEVEVSVLFVDIRDFTPFAESASAAESVTRLNEFFDLVVPILTAHGGHANKFVGDGVLGVFGAPDRLADHADRALDAACEIAEAVEERFGDRLQIGIGINSGPVIAGSVGGGGRLEFTVIGDPVNVAARVERATRTTGDVVLLTEATRCLLTRDHGELEPRGSMPLKGKSGGVALWSAKAAPLGRPRSLEALPDPA
ncbi:MAG TPA: adenylate/guanylate cyclase domain-containing protein [Thermoleophilaceae bacterium]|jgi:class 3 adenylate cyclase|nr:adenylate/guanylate cyclase domain-containing protein [Thermoleophilaceae bacterium]